MSTLKKNNQAFIVNLTTAYNMYNYEQWFLPYIQKRKLLGFDYTSHPFSVNEVQDGFIESTRKKIEKCREQWHLLLKSDLIKKGDFLKIILVIDSEQIDTNNCIDSFKCITNEITGLLKELFSEDECNRIYLQYTFLYNLERKKQKSKFENIKKEQKFEIGFTKNINVKELIFNYSYSVAHDSVFSIEYIKLSLFLANSIDWFGLGNQNNEQRIFITDNGQRKVFNVLSVELNEEKKNEYFSRILSIEDKIKDAEEQFKEKTYSYELKIISNKKIKEDGIIKEEQKEKFFRVNNLNRRIPFFYSKNSNKNALLHLNYKYWQEIEDTAEENKYKIRTSQTILNSKTFTENIEQIERKYRDLNEKLSHEKLQSKIDKNRFLHEKKTYEESLEKIADIYEEKCKNLARARHVLIFGIILVLLLYLFLLPIYRFENPISSLSPLMVISAIIFLLGFCGILYLRNQIKNVLHEVYALNYDLYKKFDIHINEINDVAAKMQNSQVLRENLSTLNGIINKNKNFQFILHNYKEKLKKFKGKGISSKSNDYHGFNIQTSLFKNDSPLSYCSEIVTIEVDQSCRDLKELKEHWQHFGFIKKLALE